MTMEEFKRRVRKIKREPLDPKRPDLKEGCKFWDGKLSHDGYSKLWFDGKSCSGHRLALVLKLGRKIKKGRMALHHCDNKNCIERKHIYEGTSQNNMDDKMRRGRHRCAFGDMHGLRLHPERVQRGEDHYGAKKIKHALPSKIVRKIKRLYSSNEFTHKKLSKKFKVSATVIRRIVTGNHWSG